jgi:hypothetical protein
MFCAVLSGPGYEPPAVVCCTHPNQRLRLPASVAFVCRSCLRVCTDSAVLQSTVHTCTDCAGQGSAFGSLGFMHRLVAASSTVVTKASSTCEQLLLNSTLLRLTGCRPGLAPAYLSRHPSLYMRVSWHAVCSGWLSRILAGTPAHRNCFPFLVCLLLVALQEPSACAGS